MVFEKIKIKFQSVGFTRQEIQIVLFLAITFLFGCILKFIPDGGFKKNSFNYSSLDRKFEEYSLKIDSISSRFGMNSDSVLTDSSILNNLSALLTPKPKKSVLLLGQKIDLNRAAKSELMLLPGIGEKMAQRILDYRLKNKKFHTSEEIQKIKGIGRKKFDELKNNIEVK
jgi:competence ComEA-like helix-hairpin-helix protein